MGWASGLKKYYLVVVVSLLSVFLSVDVRASSGYYWSKSEPIVYSSKEVSGVSYDYCNSYYKMIEISTVPDPKRACIWGTGKISFATYYDARNGFVSTVKFSKDKVWHEFTGLCTGTDSCIYIPSRDMMIAKRNLINGTVRSLTIYKNFSRRLKAELFGLTMRYRLDSLQPDYIFQSSNGYAWPIGGLGASDNGDWLAIEIRERGIGVLNLDSLSMKRVSTMAFWYGHGSDPTTEVAISNDGGHVAVMGRNAWISIFDVDDSCGDEPIDVRLLYQIPIVKPCQDAHVDTNKFISRFFAGIHPKFDESGGELDFFATSYDAKPREIVYRAGNYTGKKLTYLAMGDSYSSGEGETDDKYYSENTNTKNEKCHLSTRSYPFRLVNYQNFEPAMAKSVACSGATLTDIAGDDLNYFGQSGRLKAAGYGSSDMTLAKTEARRLFVPGRVRQEEFAKVYHPDIITIGIGGNDANLMGKLVDCASSSKTCDWAADAKRKEQVANEIKGLFDDLSSTYRKIKFDSPASKIYAVGYPKVIASSRSCGVLGVLLDDQEVKFANEAIVYLNTIIADAARASGVGYLDIYSSFGENILCGAESPSYVNGIRIGDDNKVGWFTVLGNEGFHPTPKGHEKIAEFINDNYGSLSRDYCDKSQTTCFDEKTLASAPVSYDFWFPGGEHKYPSLKSSAMITEDDKANKRVKLDSGSFKPGSKIIVQLHSEVRTIGEYTVLEDGSIDIPLNLPEDMDDGYHTLSVTGESYSGDPIELYQIIIHKIYKPATSGDLDIETAADKAPYGSDSTVAASNVDRKEAEEAKIVVGVREALDNSGLGVLGDSLFPEVKGASTKRLVQAALPNKPEPSFNVSSLIPYAVSASLLGIAIRIATSKKFKKVV